MLKITSTSTQHHITVVQTVWKKKTLLRKLLRIYICNYLRHLTTQLQPFITLMLTHYTFVVQQQAVAFGCIHYSSVKMTTSHKYIT